MSTLLSLGGLPTHPQNPHTWRTGVSLLVWPLSYGLSGLGDPTRNIKVPAGIACRVIEAHKPPTTTRWRQFNYLGCELTLDSESDLDKKINRFQGICGAIRKNLKKTRTDTQMKFYKVVARPSLLYGSETWVTTKRDITCLEAAEMRFLRSVTGYTGLDKIRSEVI